MGMEGDKEEFSRERDDDNTGIYSEDGRAELVDDDEITDVDEGFMKGYDAATESGKCSSCKTLLEGHEVITKEVKRKKYKFCSQHCLTEFEINNEEE